MILRIRCSGTPSWRASVASDRSGEADTTRYRRPEALEFQHAAGPSSSARGWGAESSDTNKSFRTAVIHNAKASDRATSVSD